MQQEDISIFPEVTVTYATFGQRLGAAILDILVLLIPHLLVNFTFGGTGAFSYFLKYHEFNSSYLLNDIVSELISWLYFASMESSRSQATVGKQALGLKVTTLHGERISFARATGRHFSKWVSAIILLFGYFMVLWDPKNQALHDKMAGTLVVKKSPHYHPEM